MSICRFTKSIVLGRRLALRRFAVQRRKPVLLGRCKVVKLSSLGTILFTCVVLLASANAQSTFGSIVGVVKDPGELVVPGAQITLTGVDDRSTRDAVSDASGLFQFMNVKAGRYEITVHANGFASFKLASVQLEARQAFRADIALKVASATQVVEVSDIAAVINTENAVISDSIENQQITELPMNSRAVSSSPLASLAASPNVVTDSQGNISVGGATAAQTGFSVDGISTANVRANGALRDAYPSSEGISETKVTAFNNNAEFAQVGDVTFTTKSGTDHGTAVRMSTSRRTRLTPEFTGLPRKHPRTSAHLGVASADRSSFRGCGTAGASKPSSLQITKGTGRLLPLPCCFLFPLRRNDRAT